MCDQMTLCDQVYTFRDQVLGITVMKLNNISNLLVTLNSSVNFIIYCIFGDKFKRIFLRLFCSQGY